MKIDQIRMHFYEGNPQAEAKSIQALEAAQAMLMEVLPMELYLEAEELVGAVFVATECEAFNTGFRLATAIAASDC